MTYLVLVESGCWVWMGSLNSSGYGPHRRFYEQAKGSVPEGQELDHACGLRPCVNPDHLEPVTRSVNLRRRTACAAGHSWTETNTYINRRGSRMCRTCRAARARELRARVGAA